MRSEIKNKPADKIQARVVSIYPLSFIGFAFSSWLC